MDCLNCKLRGNPLPKLPEKLVFPGLNSLEDAIEMVRVLQLDALDEDLFDEPKEWPAKWTASPDVLASRNRNFNKKHKGNVAKRKTRDAPEPTGPDSLVPVTDDMFHTLSIDGEIKSLFMELPPVSGSKFTRHGWVSNKPEWRSSSSLSTRKMSTGSYDTQVLYPKGFTLNIPIEMIPEIGLLNKTMRPHFASKAKTPHEQLVIHDRKSTSRRRFPCDRTPKDNIKDINSKGIISLQIIKESLPKIKRVRPIFGMKARSMVIGMHVIRTCAILPRIPPVTNGQAHQHILSLRGRASRNTADCLGKGHIKSEIAILRPSFGINSTSTTSSVLTHIPVAGDGHGGSFLRRIALRLRAGNLRNTSYCPRERTGRIVTNASSKMQRGMRMEHCSFLARESAVNGQEDRQVFKPRPIGSASRNPFNRHGEAYLERQSPFLLL